MKLAFKCQKYRLLPWLGLWTITLVILVSAIMVSTPKLETVPPLTFPDSIPLQDWIFLGSGPVNSDRLHPPTVISGQFIAGKHYRYHQQDSALDIEMTYLAHTDGDLKSVIKAKTGNLWSTLHYDNGVGTYSMFTQTADEQPQVELDACINPRGGSTVTSDQFKRNRLLYDWRSRRVLGWLLGQMPVSDRRCLWTHMTRSIPLGQNSVLVAQQLEQDWFQWYDWWRSHF